VLSHVSNSESALSPAGHRTSSTSQRRRPTPGSGSGVEGSTEMRHRVMAAVGCPILRRRAEVAARRSWAGAPPRNDGAEPTMLEPFLISGQHRLFIASLEVDDTVGLLTRLRKRGANSSGPVRHQRTLPEVRAAIPAEKSAAAPPSIAPLPPPCNFMQRAECKAATWQAGIYR